MDLLLPIAGILTLGGILGYSAATFLKSVTKIVGCLIGIVFVLLQVLAYYGFAHWDWGAVREAAGPASDAAKSGCSVLWKVITYNFPFTGGFAGGFWYGWKH